MTTLTHVDAEGWLYAGLAGFDRQVEQIGSEVSWPSRHMDRATVRVVIRSGSGKEDARAQAYAALDTALEMPSQVPAQVAEVRHVVGPIWTPLPDGQPAYAFTVTVAARATP